MEVDRILKRNGRVYPVLTRSGDYYPTLDERVDLVRRAGADLLVSVHADSTSRRSAKGFQIWIIDRSRRDVRNEARKLLKYGLRDQLASYSLRRQNLALDRQERFAVEETRRASQLMEASLDRLPGVENRGVTVHPKSLRILRHNYAPAFLIETGFLSNKQDTLRLASGAKKRQMAGAIAQGIESYFTQLRRRRVSAPLSPSLQMAAGPKGAGSPTFSGESFHYTVKRDDTLIGLARRYGVEKEDILLASNLPLSRKTLYIGDALKIPVPAREKSTLRSPESRSVGPKAVPKSFGNRSPDPRVGPPGSHRIRLCARGTRSSKSPTITERPRPI